MPNTRNNPTTPLARKVAIIGSACRFPGGSTTPQAFFDSLLSGRNYVRPVPADRWSNDTYLNEQDVCGKTYVGHGHFLEEYDFRGFDADFFNFSPREAEFLDPQQRLLLELSFEAMENAGLCVEALAGSQTGVFVGGFTVDHLLNQFGSHARGMIGAHSAAGSTLTMLSNRISYAFDFRGPSLSVDTACSSSLVAFAQGVSAILTWQCETALVGGSSFMLRPEYMVAMAKGRFLAKDGRSKSFDARGDGYGRGEGCGVVVLKDYACALRDGDEIIALVDGAGVNQDGRTSGITVPNPQAQRQLMEEVLAQSGIDAASVNYVEAHGTGTPVGDPLETRAIADVYAQGGRCRVGSVKANIGHLEAAAGVASVIKSMMMLRHNQVPEVAGLEVVNPQIPEEIDLPRRTETLGDPAQVRRIAINSFGYGGTNAHAILSSPPATTPRVPQPGCAPSVAILPLSARDTQALRERAGQLAQMLEAADAPALNDVLFTTALRRSHLDHRVAVWGDTPGQLASALRAFAADSGDFPGVEGARPFNASPRIAFVYTGMGPQWWAMGRQLLSENPVFRHTLEQADSVFQGIAGFSILEEMLRDEATSRIKHTEFAQPANLMIQIGLTAALKAEGVVADAVVGHSVGEVASAWAAGMLTLEDALRVSRERSRIQATAAGTGAMLAVGLGAEQALELMAPHGDLISLAAINSPRSVTIAGDRQALQALLAEAGERKVFAKMLDVEVPYHSPLMEALKPQIREALAGLQPVPATTALYSTVSGGLNGERLYDAQYWCDNVRNPVYFCDAITALLDDGYTHFVEVGPHPVLRRSLEETASARNIEIRASATLAMNKPETDALRRAVCAIYAQGADLDWAARTPAGQQVQLPTYPWQRQLLWREAQWQRDDRLNAQGWPLHADQGGIDLNLRRLNYLYDHIVDGSPIMPAAGFLEALCEEARERWPHSTGLSVRDVDIQQSLLLDHARELRLHVQFDATRHRATLASHDIAEDAAPLVHAQATLHPLATPAPTAIALLATGDLQALEPAAFYAQLHGQSLQYGPAFQSIRRLHRDLEQGLAQAHLRLPVELAADAPAYLLHPALLDGCFQAALALMRPEEGVFLPVSLAALHVYRPLPEAIDCRVQIVERDTSRIVCDFQLTDRHGAVLAHLQGLTCRSLQGRGKAQVFPAGDYQRTWRELPALANPPMSAQRLLLVAHGDDPLAVRFAQLAGERGLGCERCTWAQVPAHPGLGAVDRVIGLSWAGQNAAMAVTGEDELRELLLAVQALADQGRPLPLRVVTRGAHGVREDDPVQPAQAAVAGFVRVVRNEQPSLDAALVDIDEGQGLAALFAEVMADQLIDEVALREQQRYGAHLIASGLLQQPGHLPSRCTGPQAISLRQHHSAFSAHLQTPQALDPEALQVRVERLAVALEHPEQPMGVVAVVTAVGQALSGFNVGERIVALAPRHLGTELSLRPAECVLAPIGQHDTPSALIAPIQARAVALARTCALRPGARALVVEGVLGDALSAALSQHGAVVTRVAADLSDLPNAPGFDLIAADLAQWSHQAGFFALATGGQLLDLGNDPAPFALPVQCQRLIRATLDLAACRQDEAYRAALRSALATPPAALATALPGFADLLDGTALHGWIELQVAGDERPFTAAASDTPALRRDGVYLVTGGFGGLGQELARWLARHGAGHIALVGRRGADTPQAQALLAQLHNLGAQASAHALDVSDPAQVQRLLGQLHQPQAPLLGIYHAAGVLQDHLLEQMTPAHVSTVMQPKAGGAWALHQGALAIGAPLEQFVMFSSIASLVGNSRQANYCAANGFLEGLTHLRRAQGLPALSINFGAIAGVGMLESDERIGQHLTQIGLTPLDVHVALRGLGRALAKGLAQVAVSEQADWGKWAVYESVGGASPTFAELVQASRASQSDNSSLVEQLHAVVASVDDNEASGVLQSLIAECVAAGLKTSAQRLKPEQSFDSFGVDSLLSTEIKFLLEQQLGVTYSVIELQGQATIAKLAQRALSEVRSKIELASAA